MNRFFLYCGIVMVTIVFSCTKDKAPAQVDDQLLEFAKDTLGYNWFYNADSLLPRSSGSGHSESFLRTRFNSVASAYLDGQGRVLPNTVFPSGSIIVKELINTPGTVHRYAILWKNPSNEYADDAGWVWGYINGDGSTEISATLKGASCVGCHTQNNHIDQTLMNAYFP